MAVIIVRFEGNFNSRGRFSENSQILHFLKIRLVGDKLFDEEIQADMTKLTIASKFCESA